MKEEYFITTNDNPFNPFTQFEDWKHADEALGYYTLGLIARVYWGSDELSEEDQSKAFDDAIDKVLDWHGSMYKIVFKKDSKGLKSDEND